MYTVTTPDLVLGYCGQCVGDLRLRVYKQHTEWSRHIKTNHKRAPKFKCAFCGYPAIREATNYNHMCNKFSIAIDGSDHVKDYHLADSDVIDTLKSKPIEHIAAIAFEEAIIVPGKSQKKRAIGFLITTENIDLSRHDFKHLTSKQVILFIGFALEH